MKKILSHLSNNHILSLLSESSYLTFSLSVFTSQIAFNMLSIILIFLIYYLTASNFAVALLLFTILIPQIGLSFFGGVIADKNDKKTILIIGNILRALVLILLFFNWQSAVVVYITAFTISAITQFYVPAEAPIIPSIVSRDKLVAANSIFGLSLFGSILIGYIVAGPAVSLFGRAGVFIMIAALFALAGVFAFFIPKLAKIPPEIQNEDVEKTILTELKNSFSLLAKSFSVIDAFFLLIISQIIIFVLATLIPGYAKDLLQIPAENVSLVIFAPAAIGMTVAALAIGGIFHKTKKETLTGLGVLLSGAVLMLLPFTSRIFSHNYLHMDVFTFVLTLAFAAGIANALIFIPSQAVIQEVIPENFRAKIYGLLFALIGIFSLLPIMIAGGLADLIGVGAVFFFIGLIVVILGLARGKIYSLLSKIKRTIF